MEESVPVETVYGVPMLSEMSIHTVELFAGVKLPSALKRCVV
jgi:hypothetical protein